VRRALAVVATALALPAVAAAHVTIQPPFVDDGVEAEISFTVPNERPPHATTMVSVTAPPGIDVISASAPAGWQATTNGSTVTWAGGTIEGRGTSTFGMRILPRVRAGTTTFASVQTYDDTRTVHWTADLSVLPASGAAAPKEHPWLAIGAVVAALLAGASAIAIRILRGRTLQDS